MKKNESIVEIFDEEKLGAISGGNCTCYAKTYGFGAWGAWTNNGNYVFPNREQCRDTCCHTFLNTQYMYRYRDNNYDCP